MEMDSKVKEENDDTKDMTLSTLAERRDLAALAAQKAKQEVVSFNAVANDGVKGNNDLPSTSYQRTDPKDWEAVIEGNF